MHTSSTGIIGLGLLGTALAERMLAAGRQVVGYDLAVPRRHHLVALGGQALSAAPEVAAASEEVVLCLPDSRVVAAVVEELVSTLRPGMLLIDATTGDPDETVKLAARLAERGVGYMDATVAGSSEQLRQGAAVVLMGGSDVDVERGERIVQTWGEQRFHLGPAGSGSRLKLIVNLVLGLQRAVLAEGLGLATACGLDLNATLEVLKTTPAYSRIMDTKGAKMIAREYTPQARLAQHHKDVRLILDLARRHAASVPLTTLHEVLLQQAIDMGLGDADNSAIMELFRNPPTNPPSRNQKSNL